MENYGKHRQIDPFVSEEEEGGFAACCGPSSTPAEQELIIVICAYVLHLSFPF